MCHVYLCDASAYPGAPIIFSVDFEISDLRMQPFGRLFGVGIVLLFSMRKFRIEFFMIKVEVL